MSLRHLAPLPPVHLDLQESTPNDDASYPLPPVQPDVAPELPPQPSDVQKKEPLQELQLRRSTRVTRPPDRLQYS